jgi:hypothetical protein
MDKMYQRGIFAKTKTTFFLLFPFSPNFAWRLWPGFPIDGHSYFANNVRLYIFAISHINLPNLFSGIPSHDTPPRTTCRISNARHPGPHVRERLEIIRHHRRPISVIHHIDQSSPTHHRQNTTQMDHYKNHPFHLT